jgi:hypothetical protein
MAEKTSEMSVAPGTTLTETLNSGLNKIKGPVFWFAIGFALCKYMDRKKS